MISIYSAIITNRLIYVTDFVFNEILGVPFKLTSDVSELSNVVINYSSNNLDSLNYQINPSGLLFENSIGEVISNGEGEETKFFSTENDDHGFDVFSASFFHLSRMEEYNFTSCDQFNRFPADQSCIVKANLHVKPLIDNWALELLNSINQKFNVNYKMSREFNQFCTFDIDNAYAFKHKGFFRFCGSLFRDLLLLDKSKITQRINIFTANASDPYDNYQYIFNYCKSHQLQQIYFFLLGDYGENDKNISHKHPALKQLIKETSKISQVGIHPSFNSFQNREQINREVLRLKSILGQEIHLSRFHFLRFSLPSSYNHLLAAGITHDYSMGFVDRVGFRAGTCTPFYFYDLENDVKTDLKVVPFAYMDGALRDYQKKSIEEAKVQIKEVKRLVQEVKGQFTSIWHNESLSDQDRWKGWREVFESTWD